MNVAVAQLGARRHYMVPRTLDQAGLLGRFYTDIYRSPLLCALADYVPRQLRPAVFRRLLDRVPTGIDPGRITAFSRFGLEYKWRCRRARNTSELTAAWLWGGRRFCELILQQGLPSVDAVYAFNSAALELLRAARQLGKLTILDQSIAPRYVECQLLEEERTRWPGWEPEPPRDGFLNDYCERERQEWAAADLILCGSEFVRDGIAACDGPAERCTILPFSAEASFNPQLREPHSGPLRVLTVGAISLRKGSPYVLETAKRTKRVATYRMVGAIDVSKKAQMELRRRVELTGVVARSEIIEHYRWADVFLLPSLCEGSANATYEALATGLPVICTVNTGSVVRHGVDGYIVQPRGADEICRHIDFLAQQQAALQELSYEAAAARKVQSADYPRRLVDSIINACGKNSSERQAAVV